MSLLLDALDRAERARREQRSLSHPDLSLEPLQGGQRDAGNGPQGDAATLFQLGDPAGRRWSDSARRFGPWALLLLLLAIAVAGWMWSQALPPISAPPLAAAPINPLTPAPAPPLAPPAGPAASGSTGSSTGGAGALPANPPGRAAPAGGTGAAAAGPGAAPPTASAALPATPAVAPLRSAGNRHAASADAPSRRAADGADGAAGDTQPDAAPAPAAASSGPRGEAIRQAPAVDIRLFRNPASAQVDPALAEAWNALRDGHLEQAAQAYRQLEQRLPGNADVQLGLGRIAAEQGHPEEARRHYRRALEIDPHSPAGLAGLAVLEPAGGALDSRLRSRAADSPGETEFALAARLSAAGQWPEAEQAWFEALRARPGDPDLLCNLAVALDHLGQATTARQYYQEALTAADQGRPAHFNRAQVEQRLRVLAGGQAGNG